MEAVFAIGIAILAGCSMVFWDLWLTAKNNAETLTQSRDDYVSSLVEVEMQVCQVSELVIAGWVIASAIVGRIEYWTFTASDETAPRIFRNAVERQKKLDEIAMYNLPKEYEAMNDKTKA